jgi:hypothetical protein
MTTRIAVATLAMVVAVMSWCVLAQAFIDYELVRSTATSPSALPFAGDPLPQEIFRPSGRSSYLHLAVSNGLLRPPSWCQRLALISGALGVLATTIALFLVRDGRVDDARRLERRGRVAAIVALALGALGALMTAWDGKSEIQALGQGVRAIDLRVIRFHVAMEAVIPCAAFATVFGLANWSRSLAERRVENDASSHPDA